MTDGERAKLLQDDAFLSRIGEQVQRRLFNQWRNSPVDHEKLHARSQCVDEVLKAIAQEANKYKREQAGQQAHDAATAEGETNNV